MYFWDMFRSKSPRNQKLIYAIFALLLFGLVWAFDNFYTPDPYGASDGDGPMTVIPRFYIPSSTTGAIVEHQHYMLSYSEPHEQAEWVAYMLNKAHLTSDKRKRPYFIEDPIVRSKSADWRNYKGSGYDRGHLCPAGDRRFSEQAYNETFYTSNISPQDRAFNAGVWNRLEIQVRQWATIYGSVFVATGGVLDDRLTVIGEEDVAVPRFYYKIVARGDAKHMTLIAFLLPGRESKQSLSQFLVPVDVIEEMTGIDFFQELPDDMEAKLESVKHPDEWEF